MNNCRFAPLSSVLAVFIFVSFASLSAFSQELSASTQAQKSCAEMHCDFVQVDQVSKLGPDDARLKYITASGKAGTYILSCIGQDCQEPIEGKAYEYYDQPMDEFRTDRWAFLSGPNVNHQQYDLEVIVPELPFSEVRKLITECKSSDELANEVDCGKWIRRKLAIQRTACPDPAASSACNSFQELVRANDPYVMNDLAHQDHIYTCFLPAKDEFFEATFSEPTWFSFHPASAEQVKEGVPSHALVSFGGSEFAYYKGGVVDKNKSLHNIGKWIYYPFNGKIDQEWKQNVTPSKRAEFKSKNIEIEGDHWTLTDIYKNQANTETRHTVTVQLATGRFQENFALTGTGKDISENSGKCLIVPSDYY